MGLFKKIKDIFYDEEIVEVPIKEQKTVEAPIIKEEVQRPSIQEITPSVDIPRVAKDLPPERDVNTFSERELFKPEKTFDFPVFEEEPRTRSKVNVLELQKELERSTTSRTEEAPRNVNKREVSEQTTFKPSPVISPIYGILDKNYKKEEITQKKEISKPYTGEMNYDYVRRKAYGTLEDELEDTLTRVNNEIIESVNELEKEIEDLPKPSKNIEELLGEIEKNKNVSIGEMEERAKDKMMREEEENEPIEEEHEKEESSDNTLEHDLFNLIDSMYEDKEE